MPASEYKTFSAGLKAAGDAGQLVATFSRFNVIDHDGDVTLASAITDGAEVVLGSYNHSSAIGSALPIGKGVIRNDGTRAMIVAEIFNTDAARAEFAIIKGLGDLAEYSYSFRVMDASMDYEDLKAYPGARRILKELDVVEACAVMRGAGIGTGTDSAKRNLVRIPLELVDRLAAARDSGLVRLHSLGLDQELMAEMRRVRLTSILREERIR